MKKTDIAKKMYDVKKGGFEWRETLKNAHSSLGKKSGKASVNIPKGEKSEGENMMMSKQGNQRA